MRMGGGYLTAFAATSVLVWLLLRDRDARPVAVGRRGALTASIYLAQPLWLPGVLQIVTVVLVFAPPAVVGSQLYVRGSAAILLIEFGTATPTWHGAVPPSQSQPGCVAAGCRRQTYVALTGSYYLYWRSIRQVLRRPRWRLSGARASGRCADAAVPIVQRRYCSLSGAECVSRCDARCRMGAVQRARRPVFVAAQRVAGAAGRH